MQHSRVILLSGLIFFVVEPLGLADSDTLVRCNDQLIPETCLNSQRLCEFSPFEICPLLECGRACMLRR